MARKKLTALNSSSSARPIRREIDAHRTLEAGVRELVNGRWIIPAPSYFQHNARQQRA
jgi:hypothetical protein